MATFTFTLTATYIYINTGTGDMSELYADLFAAAGDLETYMTRTGADPYVYTVQGNRELRIQAAATLNHDNLGDELGWNLTVAKYPILSIYGVFNQGPGCIVTGDVNDTFYNYMYCYGVWNCAGTVANPCVIQQMRSVYAYDSDPGLLTWDYVDVKNPTISSGYLIYLRSALYGNQSWTLSLTNINFSDTGHWGYLYFDNGDYSQCTFEDWTVTDINRLLFYGVYSAKFTNVTITSNSVENEFSGCSLERIIGHYPTTGDGKYRNDGFQPGIVFDNCTFDANDSGTYTGGSLLQGSVVRYKDCTFSNASYGVVSQEGSVVIWEGTNTFTSITTADRRWVTDGTHLHARRLSITVNDHNGNPLLGAAVVVRQNEGHERWAFFTDVLGQISTVFGDTPGVVVIEKNETSTGVYDQWSDGSDADHMHSVITTYKDYTTADVRQIAFTEDKNITVQMTENEAGDTIIYDSTLYDTELY